MSKRICWCGHDRKEHSTIWSGASSLKDRPACRPDCDHHCRGFVEPQPQGAAPRAEGLREHLTDEADPLACWCQPYRDTEEPEVIIHRKEGEA